MSATFPVAKMDPEQQPKASIPRPTSMWDARNMGERPLILSAATADLQSASASPKEEWIAGHYMYSLTKLYGVQKSKRFRLLLPFAYKSEPHHDNRCPFV